MRALTGRIRCLALAIAVAIAWPANLPLSPASGASPSTAVPVLPGSKLAGNESSIQRLRADLTWQTPDGRPSIDQSEESDEGDDARHSIPVVGIMAPDDLPSLIPARAELPEPVLARKSLPLGASGRLRC